MSVLDAPHFKDEAAAYAYVEARVWPDGRVCPHCGTLGRSGVLAGKSTRLGVYKCYACRKPFTVKVRTIFEASHIPMHIWLQAIFLMCSSKKGISSNQLHRTLGVTLKSAWFMSHRIREAMRSGKGGVFGTGGGAVEVDETFIGREPNKEFRRGTDHKMKVLSLIDRTSGQSRSFVVDDLRISTVAKILEENVSREALLMSDEALHYKGLGVNFAAHGMVKHGDGQYVDRDNPAIHTNTIEGFYSVFKRGMRGVYQHCGKNHLHRYTAEFDFRYSNRVKLGVDDVERTDRALAGAWGRRLTYQTVGERAQA